MTENKIAIVAMGVLLPDTYNEIQFWDHLKSGKTKIKSSTSRNGQWCASLSDQTIQKIVDEYELRGIAKTKFQTFGLKAMGDIINQLGLKYLSKKNLSFCIGSMSNDEELKSYFLSERKHLKKIISEAPSYKRIEQYLERYSERGLDQSVFNTSLFDKIKKRYGISGSGCFIDAACASSLAAIDVASKQLLSYQSDIVITGGIEANLSELSFEIFKKANALSATVCNPFSSETNGTALGEGTVLFALQRLKDATNEGQEILAIINSITGQTSGKGVSLFASNSNAQQDLYREVYKNTNMFPKYIEAHGTGTEMGDIAEEEGIKKFFSENIPRYDSVKSIYGHARGAAGAISIMKAIMSFKHKLVPFPKQNTDVRIEKIDTIGVSAFGFGGINYHCNIGLQTHNIETNRKHAKSICISNQTKPQSQISDIKKIAAQFKIPRTTIKVLDHSQILALELTDKLIKESRFNIRENNKQRIGVISASITGTNALLKSEKRLIYKRIEKTFRLDLSARIKQLPKITENTGIGVLNNIIAGRVANHFDLKGKNFNIDSDYLSTPAAYQIAYNELQNNLDAIFLISVHTVHGDNFLSSHNEVQVSLLTTEEFAKANCLPVKSYLHGVHHEL